jgi:UDP-N-acetylmuramoyl-L-alanyl-D-glutamate--2,6-diaminopimelate ligase
MHLKPLTEITQALQDAEIIGSTSVMVNNLVMDSRQVNHGSCFFAIRGAHSDGHEFISEAIAGGATVVVCETLPETYPDEVTMVRVKDVPGAMGLMASAFFKHPSHALTLVGVTGTNGKTTIATLLYETFTQMGYRCGLISTIRYINPAGETEASHTTPDAIRLQKMLSEMVDQGCEYCFMEVSSHAVVQKRIAGLHFAGGIFTNLTHDHLDFHPTFDDYLKAKQGFFTSLSPEAFALTSRDDRNGRVMVQNSRARIYTYSINSVADFHARIIENTIDGMQLELAGRRVWTKLIGAFNASNIAAVYATSMILQMEEEEVLEILSNLEAVEGRFQQYRSPMGITAVVDYAHTPDALKNVLETIRQVNSDEGMVITVVGAGGDRDPFKRPMMAKIAAAMSDKVILTSDNPRSESPEKIIADMQEGLDPVAIKKTLSIVDRKEAIKTAVMLAEPNTIILIAGKGHEKTQEINGVKSPFDDMEIIRTFMDSAN